MFFLSIVECKCYTSVLNNVIETVKLTMKLFLSCRCHKGHSHYQCWNEFKWSNFIGYWVGFHGLFWMCAMGISIQFFGSYLLCLLCLCIWYNEWEVPLCRFYIHKRPGFGMRGNKLSRWKYFTLSTCSMGIGIVL